MTNEFDEEREEFGADLVTLVDDDGNEHEFELLDDTELEDGRKFVALMPSYSDPDEALQDSGELVILQVFEEDGEEYLEPIQDEELFDRVSKIFVESLSDEFEIEE